MKPVIEKSTGTSVPEIPKPLYTNRYPIKSPKLLNTFSTAMADSPSAFTALKSDFQCIRKDKQASALAKPVKKRKAPKIMRYFALFGLAFSVFFVLRLIYG